MLIAWFDRYYERSRQALAAGERGDRMRGTAPVHVLGSNAGLLERSEQLSVLGEALAEMIASSRGRVALVAGEAGIGKTALLRRFCADADGLARVLWAGCEPLFTPRPLGPVQELARMIGDDLAAIAAAGAGPFDVATAPLRELGSAGPSVALVIGARTRREAGAQAVRLGLTGPSEERRPLPAQELVSQRSMQSSSSSVSTGLVM